MISYKRNYKCKRIKKYTSPKFFGPRNGIRPRDPYPTLKNLVCITNIVQINLSPSLIIFMCLFKSKQFSSNCYRLR